MSMLHIAFKDILERALLKKPPFEGKRRRSDKGFKDAVLWESIIKFRIERPFYKIVLLTSDQRFNHELIDEYKSTFEEDILIYKNIDELNEYLTTLTNNVSADLLKEIQLSKKVNKYLLNSKNAILAELKTWLEEREAYGPGIDIFDILKIDIKNIVPAYYSTYEVNGEYFSLVRVQASGLNNGVQVVYSANLYLDISILDNNGRFALALTGLTLSSNEFSKD